MTGLVAWYKWSGTGRGAGGMIHTGEEIQVGWSRGYSWGDVGRRGDLGVMEQGVQVGWCRQER